MTAAAYYDLFWRQENGPGRSNRCARAFEFQDQRPIFRLHDENPFCVMLRRNGPNRTTFRYSRDKADTSSRGNAVHTGTQSARISTSSVDLP